MSRIINLLVTYFAESKNDLATFQSVIFFIFILVDKCGWQNSKSYSMYVRYFDIISFHDIVFKISFNYIFDYANMNRIPFYTYKYIRIELVFKFKPTKVLKNT